VSHSRDFAHRYRTYRSLVDRYLKGLVRETKPRTLYGPIKYVLRGGGKRIRPILTLLACEAAGGRTEDAIHAGAGIEILHNFTLVHDDIMDNAASRRGRATVHTQWDANVAILVGDELLALAYRALLQTRSNRIHEITKVFTEGVVEVCEGQAYDKEFEQQRDVTVQDYLRMIRKKTAKLVAVSTELGALVADANNTALRALRSYGDRVGRAFQVQDDLLDIIADEKEFGKTIGGDLEEGKKTYLYLEALRRVKGKDRQLLLSVARNGGVSRRHVKHFQRIYRESGAIDAAHTRIARDIAYAKRELERLPESEARAMLSWFADMLLHRTY
jgi:geranylgeranyl diphosphate synthase type II